MGFKDGKGPSALVNKLKHDLVVRGVDVSLLYSSEGSSHTFNLIQRIDLDLAALDSLAA